MAERMYNTIFDDEDEDEDVDDDGDSSGDDDDYRDVNNNDDGDDEDGNDDDGDDDCDEAMLNFGPPRAPSQPGCLSYYRGASTMRNACLGADRAQGKRN